MRVIDHGEGMAPEVLERIRKPYFTTREGGTGLGVAVARGLVEQHGGRLSYESVRGKGTTVSIELPRCAATAANAQKLLPMPCRKASEAVRPVDDQAPVSVPAVPEVFMPSS